jgi:predicted DNA binding CopG/RHH family protein
MGYQEMKRLELISDIIKDLQKTIDDIEWENYRDPRIEDLIQQLNYYKRKHENGETHEPRF